MGKQASTQKAKLQKGGTYEASYLGKKTALEAGEQGSVPKGS